MTPGRNVSNSVRRSVLCVCVVALAGRFWLQFWLGCWLRCWPFWLEFWLRCWLLVGFGVVRFGLAFLAGVLASLLAFGRFGLSCWLRCWPFVGLKFGVDVASFGLGFCIEFDLKRPRQNKNTTTEDTVPAYALHRLNNVSTNTYLEPLRDLKGRKWL